MDPPDDPTPEQPQPAAAIPPYVYEVHIANAQNTCGAADPGAFDFLVLPQNDGDQYRLYGISDTLELVTVVRDTMKFSIPVAIETGTAQISGKWIFTAERHTFAGTTSYDIQLTGRQPCTFTFATTGTHDIHVGTPDPHDAGVPNAASRPATLSGSLDAAHVTARVAAGPRSPAPAVRPSMSVLGDPTDESNAWGPVGNHTVLGAQCMYFGPSSTTAAFTTFTFNTPFPSSRTNGQEYVAFRYQLHGSADPNAAATAALQETLSPFSTNDLIVIDSGWWFTKVGPSGDSFNAFVFGELGWAGADQANSNQVFKLTDLGLRSLQAGAGWYVTLDLYWFAQGGMEAGWHRQLVPFGSGYMCNS